MNSDLRGLILPGVLSLVGLAILISFGNWQMDRLAWKEDLIERVSQRPFQPPLDFRDDRQWTRAYDSFFGHGYEYFRIVMEGEYITDKEARVFTSLPAESAKGPANGPGHWIMTPFRFSNAGDTVWVNRGFVPEGSDWSTPPQGRTTITGLIRPDDPPGLFTPENRPEENLFFSRSVEALSSAKGVSAKERGSFEPFTIDLLPTAGAPALPQAGETRMTFTNNHLGYALTWYGLAAALVAVFASFAWSRVRGEIGSPRLTPPGPAP